jgi:hypothetical protein
MIELTIQIKECPKDEVIIDANFDIDENPTGTEIELEAANLLLDEIDEYIKDINIIDAKLYTQEICKKVGK